MSTITSPPPRLYTPDDLLEMPDGKHYELVDGRLMESNVGAISSLYSARIGRILDVHCQETGLAWVFDSSLGYICFPGKPRQLRRPDVSCVLVARLPREDLDVGNLTIRPDIAVEVLSPNDRIYEFEEKLADYRDAAIPLVWVVYPPTRRVRVIRGDGSSEELGPEGELSGESILPGLRCRVADLFDGLGSPAAVPTP